MQHLPFPLVTRTEQQQRQLRDRVSGPELFSGEDTSFPLTGPITAVAEATPAMPRSKSMTYINNGDLAPIELLTCAIMSYRRKYKAIPSGIYVSIRLSAGIQIDLRDYYDEESFDGTIPFLVRQGMIQRISIFFARTLSKDRVICV